jgi:5-methylcytosine-specific restriction endonuclease McrA
MLQGLENKIGCNCPYCGVQMGRTSYQPSRDHMVPRSRGGILNRTNKAIVCQPCNWDKGDLTIHEFYIELVKRRDPRAAYVNRLINGMQLYLAGRLRIPLVTKDIRATYPKLQGKLATGKDFLELHGKVGCGCPYCGVVMGLRSFKPTVDLLVPKSRGGARAPDNKVTVCEPCKDAKGDLTVREFFQVLMEDGDPRAHYVGRLIRNLRAYFEGRLRIPLVSRDGRMTYPSVAYSLGPPEEEFDSPSLVAEQEPELGMAPAFGM